jgi:hypothetical protein
MYNVSLKALGKTIIWTTNEIILDLVHKEFIERDTVEYTYNMMANESMHHTGPTKIMTLSLLLSIIFVYTTLHV